jgi:hemoglobin-like flavoprotein
MDGWETGAVSALGAALLGPTMFMMGRKVFRRRKQETKMADDETDQTKAGNGSPDRPADDESPLTVLGTWPVAGNDGTDPQVKVREQAMVTETFSTDKSPGADMPRTPWPPPRLPRLSGPAAGGVIPPQHPRNLAEQEQRWAAEGIDVARSTPTPTIPAQALRPARVDCEHCGGRGFMPGINDLLKDSIALVADQGDEVVRLFYSALLRAHPQLLTLFPGDPTQGDFGTDHRGAQQRDKLLRALVALSDLYDPSNAEKMAHLDQALATYGRAHASFVRQDGTAKGATLEEYAAVKEALFSTLVRAAGGKWSPDYTIAWGQAYDYAAAVMLAEQHRSGFAAPRFARTTG